MMSCSNQWRSNCADRVLRLNSTWRGWCVSGPISCKVGAIVKVRTQRRNPFAVGFFFYEAGGIISRHQEFHNYMHIVAVRISLCSYCRLLDTLYKYFTFCFSHVEVICTYRYLYSIGSLHRQQSACQHGHSRPMMEDAWCSLFLTQRA